MPLPAHFDGLVHRHAYGPYQDDNVTVVGDLWILIEFHLDIGMGKDPTGHLEDCGKFGLNSVVHREGSDIFRN